MSLYVAFEGGASRTSAGLYDERGALLRELKGGPSNPVAYGTANCVRVLTALGRELLAGNEEPREVLAGISGALDVRQRTQIARELSLALRAARTVVTTDLHPMLLANAPDCAAVLAIAGTGASVLGRDAQGRFMRVGGRGVVFGDEGSAYQIAVSALRAAAHAEDGTGPETALRSVLPEAAELRVFEELTIWAAGATKRQIAGLTLAVNQAAESGDFIARACIEEQARRMASQVLAARKRLGMRGVSPVFTHGGLFDHCDLYRQTFGETLDAFTDGLVGAADCSGHCAALSLRNVSSSTEWATVFNPSEDAGQAPLPATEDREVFPKTLDQMDAMEIVQHMNALDAAVAAVVADQAELIAQAVQAAGKSIQQDGRILYIGAGTSGRLGVLDASECPPTFGVPADRVVGIIAGGDLALRSSIEGVEDDRCQGQRDIAAHSVGPSDLVVGVAASGTTPYTLAALEKAKALGAATVLVCCNPAVAGGADIVVALNTGAEVLAGSTRLKAGTATKMALNMISTGAMALSGYVHEGMMVGVSPANAKLRQRAVRIVASLTRRDEDEAARLLAAASGRIPVAVLMGIRGLNPEAAVSALDAADWLLAKALEDTR